MQHNMYWKKGIFSDTYRIFSNNQQIGELKNKAFSQSSVAELNGKSYTFKTKGFFRQHTIIIDNSDDSVSGEIAYNSWMTKAFLSINGRKYTWKYENVWNTKWSIYEAEKAVINYQGSSTGGKIFSEINNDFLLLTGLYVTNFYWQISVAVLVAVFIPILSSSN